MHTRSAVEIARAALREVFPTAPEDGLDGAARHFARWGVLRTTEACPVALQPR